MKIVHILADGPSAYTDSVISAQSKEHEIKVVDLTKSASYESLVDDIFSSDRVMSW